MQGRENDFIGSKSDIDLQGELNLFYSFFLFFVSSDELRFLRKIKNKIKNICDLND